MSPVSFQISGQPMFCKSRSIALGLQEAVKHNINDLVQRQILTPVESSKWATPIVTPLKSNGLPRVCGDYRITINPLLHQRACTLQEPEDIFAKLNGAEYFSRIDLKDAFLQIPLTNDAKELTSINTPFGLYMYNFLPFGLTISPSVFQEAIDNIQYHCIPRRHHSLFIDKIRSSQSTSCLLYTSPSPRD